MKISIRNILALFYIIIFVFLSNSCILDEFKFDEIHLKDEWKIEVIAPLFYGNLSFKDLVHDWKNIDIKEGEKVVTLQFSDELTKIPLRYIYEPVMIIKGFNFLIEGQNYLNEVEFVYTVSNGSPFPLNFQMNFYDKNNLSEIGPAIVPPSFTPGSFQNGAVLPVETVASLKLNTEQLMSIKKSNRINFTTWFEEPENKLNTDTLWANYPIKITIVFKGVLDSEYD